MANGRMANGRMNGHDRYKPSSYSKGGRRAEGRIQLSKEMLEVFAAVEGRDEEPGGGFVFGVELVRAAALQVAHEVGDGVGGVEDPVAVV